MTEMMNWHLLFVMLSIGFTATYVWRFLGVLLADRLDTDMPVVYWVELVGYGLLAAIMARVVILPVGPLTETPLWLRVSVILVSIGLARIAKVANLPAIVAAAALFAAGLWFLG